MGLPLVVPRGIRLGKYPPDSSGLATAVPEIVYSSVHQSVGLRRYAPAGVWLYLSKHNLTTQVVFNAKQPQTLIREELLLTNEQVLRSFGADVRVRPGRIMPLMGLVHARFHLAVLREAYELSRNLRIDNVC